MTSKATLLAGFPEARRISNFLERDYCGHGVAVSLDERPDGLWAVEAYFEAGTSKEIADTIRDRLGSDAFGALHEVEELPDTDWVAAGLASLKPVAVGRFLVHGSHARPGKVAGQVGIEIEAGLAFGTGHHATTAGCLSAIDRLTRRRQFLNPLDLGAGTGVLAIALAKTLRRPVLASDIDPVATATIVKNAAINGVLHLVAPITTAGVDHSAIREAAPFDLIVANILAEPLIRLAPKVAPLLSRDGVLILSGLLEHQRARVIAAYGNAGLKLLSAKVIEGWVVLVLGRR